MLETVSGLGSGGALIAGAQNVLSIIASRRIAREGLWLVAGHAVTAVTGIVSVRLFTELAPQSVFGAANLLIGMLILGVNVVIAPITQTQLRYHTAYIDRGDAGPYTWLISRLVAGSVLPILVVMCSTLMIWPSTRGGASVAVIGWLALWVVLSTTKGVLLGRLHAERQQRRYALWAASESALTVLCTGSVLAASATVEGFIAGQVLGVAGALLFFAPPHIKDLLRTPTPDRLFRKRVRMEIAIYGLPFVGFGILGWLSNLSERYVLAARLDTSTVGQYVAAFAIASRLPLLAGGVLSDLFRPMLFELENRADGLRANWLFLGWLAALASIVASLVTLLFVFGDVVAHLALAEPYRAKASEIMCWVAFGYGLMALVQVVEIRILSFDSSFVLLWCKSVGALANIASAICFVPINGLVGAAQANAMGHGLQMLMTIVALVYVVRRGADAANSEDPASLRVIKKRWDSKTSV